MQITSTSDRIKVVVKLPLFMSYWATRGAYSELEPIDPK